MSALISRQAAIDALNDVFNITGKANAIAVQDYIRRVNIRLHDLPSAQPEQKWISISERLPEAEVEVFVYLFDRPSPYIAWISKKDGKWHTQDFMLEVDENPDAWMPLPEPYREEQDE